MSTIMRPASRRYRFLDAPLPDAAPESGPEALTPAGEWVHRRKAVSRALSNLIAELAGLEPRG